MVEVTIDHSTITTVLSYMHIFAILEHNRHDMQQDRKTLPTSR